MSIYKLLIVLILAVIGFYFGKFVGAIGLAGLYLYFFYLKFIPVGRRANAKQTHASRESESNIVSSELGWAYQLLRVTPTTKDSEIKLARNRLLKQYHPDKLAKNSEINKKTAEEKIHQINRAYDVIKADRNI